MYQELRVEIKDIQNTNVREYVKTNMTPNITHFRGKLYDYLYGRVDDTTSNTSNSPSRDSDNYDIQVDSDTSRDSNNDEAWNSCYTNDVSGGADNSTNADDESYTNTSEESSTGTYGEIITDRYKGFSPYQVIEIEKWANKFGITDLVSHYGECCQAGYIYVGPNADYYILNDDKVSHSDIIKYALTKQEIEIVKSEIDTLLRQILRRRKCPTKSAKSC